MTNAESTIRFAIRGGIMASCEKTGIFAGPEADALENAIFDNMTSSSFLWAMAKLAMERSDEPK